MYTRTKRVLCLRGSNCRLLCTSGCSFCSSVAPLEQFLASFLTTSNTNVIIIQDTRLDPMVANISTSWQCHFQIDLRATWWRNCHAKSVGLLILRAEMGTRWTKVELMFLANITNKKILTEFYLKQTSSF